MRITIEDLEALKELNDELEENHIETEKALQDDLGTSPQPEVDMQLLTLAKMQRNRSYENIPERSRS